MIARSVELPRQITNARWSVWTLAYWSRSCDRCCIAPDLARSAQRTLSRSRKSTQLTT